MSNERSLGSCGEAAFYPDSVKFIHRISLDAVASGSGKIQSHC